MGALLLQRRPSDRELIVRATVAWRLFLGAAGLLALLYAAACAYLWTQQRTLIFLPTATVLHTPADVGAEFRELKIPAADGGVINAWWLPTDSGRAATATLLYLRGNDGNLGREVNRLQSLRRHGLPILAIDYRGYGRSSGHAPSESQVYDDATAAWDYLVKVQSLEPSRIVIYGHSLGGAVAAELALRRGPPCAAVFEATFTSMAELGRLEYPMIPVDWLLHQRFDTLSKIRRLEIPMLFVHGTVDDEIPPSMTEHLYRSARGEKQLVMVKGAGHEDALVAGGDELLEAVARLVQRCGRQ